jgi:hypothetical protein
MKVSQMEAGGSKTLVPSEPGKEPSWLVWTLVKAFRVVLLTVLWTGLGMGAALFCGIIGLLAAGVILHRTPEMSLAYRSISIPVAIASGSIAFLWNMVRTLQAAAQRRRAR